MEAEVQEAGVQEAGVQEARISEAGIQGAGIRHSCCYDRASFESLSLGASKVITNTEWMERASHRKYILEGSEVPSINNTKLVEGGTRLVLS